MIVLCPGCKTRYGVEENKIGDEGLRLRCSKCNTLFKVLKPKTAPAAAPAPAAPAAPRPAAAPPAVAPKPAVSPSPPRPVAPAAPKPVAAPPPAAARPAPAAPVSAKAPAPPAPSPAVITGPFKPAGPPKASVIVGDVDEAYLKHLTDLLVANGYLVYKGRNGKVIMNFIQQRMPEVAVVEVALPDMFGFQIAEAIRGNPVLAARVKVILLGSVYEKERFRREPQSLYGADEYVEKHHDGPEVLKKIQKLLAPPPPPEAEEPVVPMEPEPVVAPAPPAPAPAAPARPVAPPVPKPAPVAAPVPVAPRPAPVAAPVPKPAPIAAPAAVAPRPVAPPAAAPAPGVPEDPAHQKAQRLARAIVSDILVYNPDLVNQGVRDGNLRDLLAKDITEGRNHYEKKVAPEIRSQVNYLEVAIEELIRKKKKELGLS